MSDVKTMLFVDSSLSRMLIEQLYLVNKLLDEGLQVIIVGNDDISTPIEIPVRATILTIPSDIQGAGFFQRIAYQRYIGGVCRNYAPDFVYTQSLHSNIYASKAAIEMGIPVIVIISALGTLYTRSNWRNIRQRAKLKRVFSKAYHVIVKSNSKYITLLNRNLVTIAKSTLIENETDFSKVAENYKRIMNTSL